MRLRYIWYSLFFICFCSNRLYSQSVKKIRFNNIRQSEGLSNNMVNATLRDNLGFLWIATNDGLCRYDGPNQLDVFRVTDREGGNSLESSNIRSIYEDSQQNLWIGTRLGGLTKYHRPSGSWKTFMHDVKDPTSISNDEVLKIMEDSQQRLWIGTEDGLNLFDYKSETFTRFLLDKTDPYNLTAKAILDIFEDDKGWIWVGTWAGGLHLLLSDKNGNEELGKFRQINPAENKTTHNIWKIYQDRQKRYWLGAHGGGLFLMQLPLMASNQIDKQNWVPQFHNYIENEDDKESLTSNSVQDILQDKKGQLWIATRYGLNCVEEKYLPDTKKYTAENLEQPELKFVNFHFDAKDIHSLAGNNVMNIIEDEQGLMWFATANGVSMYSWYNSQFNAHELFTKGLKTTNAKNLYVDENKTIWMGGGQYGLLKYDLESGQTIDVCKKNPELFIDNYVSSIRNNGDEWMYVATKLGVTLFNLKTYQYKKYPTPEWLRKEVANFYVQTIFIDSEDRIWLGTEVGLYSIDSKTGIYASHLKDLKKPYSISDNSINDIVEDSQGNLWIATFNGLNKVASEDISTFKCQHFFYNKEQPENTIIGNQIVSLEIIHQKLYLGSTAGLGSYDLVSKQFTNYSTNSHKFWIQSIEPTKEGNLWASTTQGLFYFDINKNEFNVFEEVDGLTDLSFLLGSSAQDKEGHIYFGTRSGFTQFHSERFFKNRKRPEVYLTNLKKVNSNGEMTLNGTYRQEVELNYDDYYLAINFAALNYNRAEKNQYAYRLEGFEDSWTYTEFGIPIVYTNLEPKTYIFRVKAANNDGVWNEEGASLTIIKHAAFWETWWFRLGGFLLLTISLIFGMNRYTDSIRKKNLVLKKYNDNLNNEIEERKKVEKALANKEEFSQLIMNNIPQFIYWVDKEHTFLGGNRTSQKFLLGNNKEELAGKKITDFYEIEDYLIREKEILARVIATESPIYRQVSEMGSSSLFKERWIERNFIPLHNEEGVVIGMLVSGSDISDRIAKKKLLTENAEKLTEYNKELKRSNQDLEQFAYIASHDLNEPLRMIGNFSGLLAKKYKTNLDDEAFQYIDFIEDGVSRMSKLINNLLTYSRVGRKEVKYRKINLKNLIDVKIFDLSEMVKDRNAEIRIDPMPTIFGEKEQIGMVFYNLINNGIKFNKNEKPSIIIKYHEQVEDGFWKFSVSDNGIGIAPEYQYRIFEIFKRLHNKRDFAGTGIGLSVCQKIIFRHSGKIWLEPNTEKGTTFYFTISKSLKNEDLLEKKERTNEVSLS